MESGSDAADLASVKKDQLVSLVQNNYEESSDSLVSWLLDSWTDSQLKSFLDYHKIPNPTPRNRDSLLQTARGAYSNIASIGPSAYDTLFANWQDSDLKAWCDTKGIPVPQGSTKESILAQLRKNTASFTEQAKQKLNDITSQTGDKVFDSWSESQLKELLDENGIPAPQGSKVNELRALARKNYKSLKNSASEYYAAGASSVSKSGNSAYAEATKSASSAASVASKSSQSAASVASKSAESAASVASKSAASAASVASKSAQSIAAEASKSGKKYGAAAQKSAESAASVASKSAESLASVASNAANSYAAIAAKSGSSIYNEATKSAASVYGEASASASSLASDAATNLLGSDNAVYTLWSESRLKSFLDARGIPVPQNGKKDELTALVRENSRKAKLHAEDFESWSSAQLKEFAKTSKIKLNKAADSSREELVKQTQIGYNELSKKGDAAAAEAKKQYENVKASAFDTWSDSDLKSFLDSYGVSVPQNGAKDQLVALARRNAHYFSNGQLGPTHGSGLAQIATDGINALFDFIKQASGVGYNKAAQKAEEAKEHIKGEL